LTITHHGDDYQLTLEVLPASAARCAAGTFQDLIGPYRLALILAPHLGSHRTPQ
jgi:hypothetical protein